MTPSLFPPTTDEMCQAAMDRIAHYANRACAQHRFHIRVGFAVLRVQMGVV